ncbi:MAG: competence protein ComK [Solibacillus sp.]
MEIRKSYIITSKTIAIMPFVTENGELYTVVLETGAIAIIAKPPTTLIKENEQFIISQKQNVRRIYEDLWEKELIQNGKKMNIKFKFRMDEQNF